MIPFWSAVKKCCFDSTICTWLIDGIGNLCNSIYTSISSCCNSIGSCFSATNLVGLAESGVKTCGDCCYYVGGNISACCNSITDFLSNACR